MFYAVIFADCRIADIAFFGLNKQLEPEEIYIIKSLCVSLRLFSLYVCNFSQRLMKS